MKSKKVHDLGIEIALVIGGGNLWRGEPAAEAGMDRVQADYTGMLGTVMNALVMADSLQQVGLIHVCKQPLQCNKWQSLTYVDVPFVTLKKAVSLSLVPELVHLTSQLIQQQPFVQLKSKRMPSSWLKNGVDGVYNADPKKDKTAVKFEELTHRDVINKGHS